MVNDCQERERYERNPLLRHEYFAFAAALGDEGEDSENRSVEECLRKPDWKFSEKAINAGLDSLNKRQGFGPLRSIPQGICPVGYKWVFVRKRDDKGNIYR
ncbi:hypothetical protein BDK51DRAFT_25259 [Blyttiomyces helicus]|uniref:Reverse transcriptase Ty1/copia-type domain-containing protein n=1 Tax=Blyttiomyces helicus TaxID=388810 RepID=A0A4P9W9N6_9FUNG|nr:hypothetical protein BDK51DRAFT_25259 [Blyttiomyces helicus]|eukprot:RKO89269.1 hypothetical protein BDK51DRAFT_25259 [Blyttiomyces helicus]